jgi:hypothetical protein
MEVFLRSRPKAKEKKFSFRRCLRSPEPSWCPR